MTTHHIFYIWYSDRKHPTLFKAHWVIIHSIDYTLNYLLVKILCYIITYYNTRTHLNLIHSNLILLFTEFSVVHCSMACFCSFFLRYSNWPKLRHFVNDMLTHNRMPKYSKKVQLILSKDLYIYRGKMIFIVATIFFLQCPRSARAKGKGPHTVSLAHNVSFWSK